MTAMLEYEIESFGHRIGLDSLSLSPQGLACLAIENVGSLYLEKVEERGRSELLVYVAAPLPVPDDGAVRRLLELCDYRHARPMPVSAGVFSGRAVLLTRMDESAVTAAGIENALRMLTELLHGVL